MIISDTYRFVFVHIPKCAGTTVRMRLQGFDTRNGEFYGVRQHPQLGRLEYGHIPLFTLREYFPEEFATVRDYWSFAVVREPFSRFGSSISQRLKEYIKTPIHKLGMTEIMKHIDECIEYLSQQPRHAHLLQTEYKHFQKQIDFLEVDGECLIDTIYTLGQIDLLLNDVGQRVGRSITEPEKNASSHENRTVVFRNEVFRKLIEAVRPLSDRAGKILPEGMKQNVRDYVYVSQVDRLKDVFAMQHVKDFIKDYYAEDFQVYERTVSKADVLTTS